MALLTLLNKSRPRTPRYPDTILPLNEADLPHIHAANRNRLNTEKMAAQIREMPGLSQWHPASGEFVMIGPWRNRADIPTVSLLSSLNHAEDLVRAAVAAAANQDATAFVVMEAQASRRHRFYEECGFGEIDRIITYRHQRVQDFLDVEIAPRQEFQVVTSDDAEMLAEVMRLDEAAFGGLWMNSVEEFRWWLDQPSVEMFAGVIDGRVSSYFGTTVLPNFAHLDRIAVDPALQGRGLGRETLRVAMRRAAWLGANAMALSTQESNGTSRAMYERAGFARTPGDDYHMYGVVFDHTDAETDDV